MKRESFLDIKEERSFWKRGTEIGSNKKRNRMDNLGEKNEKKESRVKYSSSRVFFFRQKMICCRGAWRTGRQAKCQDRAKPRASMIDGLRRITQRCCNACAVRNFACPYLIEQLKQHENHFPACKTGFFYCYFSSFFFFFHLGSFSAISSSIPCPFYPNYLSLTKPTIFC